MTQERRRSSRRLWLSVVLLVVLGTGCGGGKSETTTGVKVGSDNLSVISEKLVKLFLCCNKTQNVQDSCFENVQERVWDAPKEVMSTMERARFFLEPIHGHPHCSQAHFRANVSAQDTSPSRNWFYPNGYLRVGKEFYAPDEFCIESTSTPTTTLHLKLCPPDCGNTRPCIPKCCQLDKVYSIGVNGPRGCHPPITTQATTPQPLFFNPPLYTNYHTPSPLLSSPNPHYFLWKNSDFRYNCFENRTTLFPLSDRVAHNLSTLFNASFHSANFRIRVDGALLYMNPVDKKCSVEMEPKRVMCFDGVQDYGGQDEFGNTEDEYIVHLCTSWKVEHVGSHENVVVYGILLLCASIFPLITSAVYISLWRRQNVHGWTIAATTGSLFLMYLFQGIALIVGDLNEREDSVDIWGCSFIAIVGHFSFLAAFSWMTVMCCDLWLTFRSITPTNRHAKGQQRYLKYSLFGWGLPTAFVGTGVILDYYFESDDCTPHLVPGYGQMNCWVLPNSQGVYNYYPVAVLFSMNLFFFGVTCMKLLQYRANTRFATKSDTDHWKGFTRFFKLLVIMGVTWVFDMLSWSIDGHALKWYWMIFDVINILRAVGVFVVYVCKQDIVQMLEEKHPRLKKLLRPFKRRCSNELTEATGSTINSPRILETESTAFQMG